MAAPKILEMDLAVQIDDALLRERDELRAKVAWWEEKFSVLVENTGAKRERDDLLAALRTVLDDAEHIEEELGSEHQGLVLAESFPKARALIARIEKPAPVVETRSRFRCKECGFEHWGGEPCCGHGEACVEVPAP